MPKTFKSKMRKIMDYNMLQKKESEFPSDIGEFESFEDFIEEFEAK